MGHQWEDRDGFRYKTDGKVVALVARLPEGERQELLVAIDSGVAAREILRLAEERKALLQGLETIPKLEQAILARVRRELLSWVTANTWVGRPDEFPQGVLDKGRFLIAMDSICPEE